MHQIFLQKYAENVYHQSEVIDEKAETICAISAITLTLASIPYPLGGILTRKFQHGPGINKLYDKSG